MAKTSRWGEIAAYPSMHVRTRVLPTYTTYIRDYPHARSTRLRNCLQGIALYSLTFFDFDSLMLLKVSKR